MGHVIETKIAWVCGLFALGCAQSIGDIDRTQPNLVDKDHFEGQWFVRETVVGVPPTSPAAFVGDMGGLEVVVWDIQESWLVGYRAYEQVPGADPQVASALARPGLAPVSPGRGDGRRPDVYHGNPVVAYRIKSHVDVQRSYNPRTGEQSNVIIENTTDRPWYERSFMRVDWSANDVASFAVEARPFWPLFGTAATMESFIPRDEGGPGAFRMELDEQGRANYIDFTVRRTVVPSVTGCAALLFESEIGDCTGEEIETRTSLLRVDSAREQDYVPLRYDDHRQGEFGFFRVVRPTYDDRLGGTLSGRVQLASRHDMWQRSRDESGEPLPPRARTLRPVIYTLSEHYPEEMLSSARQMADEYDLALQQVAAASRGQSLEELRDDLLDDTGGSCLFCLDENLDQHARNGDLRYNFIYWVHDRQAIAPLGFGPSSVHPETGRIVSASAYVYGAEIDRYAETARQIVDLINGQIDEEDVFDESYFVAARRRSGLVDAAPALELPLDAREAEGWWREALGQSALERLASAESRGQEAFLVDTPELDRARLANLAGTPLEARMLPEEWAGRSTAFAPSFLERLAAAQQSRRDSLPEISGAASERDPLDVVEWFGRGATAELEALTEMASRNNLWLASFSDPAILGLAEELAREGLGEEELYQRLREGIYRAVALHEIGHTLGLRHNFAASADPLNYHDAYWGLRMESIRPVQEYISSSTPNPNALLRSNCAVTAPLLDRDAAEIAGTGTEAACAAQRSAGMSELMYSSVMDYEGRFNAHFHGLGHYDHAALAAGYGDLVEVFDDAAVTGLSRASEQLGVRTSDAIRDANRVRNPALGEGLDLAMVRQGGGAERLSHYSNYPALFGGHENIARRRLMPRAEYIAALEQIESGTAEAEPPLEVPYLSCYDEYVGAVETCHRWDLGADHYEIVEGILTAYEQYYIFNNFRRDRMGFDSFKVLSRTASRYFIPLSTMYQHWVWGAAVTGYSNRFLPRGQLAAAAAVQGFSQLANTLSRPRPGPHVYDPARNEYVPADAPECPEGAGEAVGPREGSAVFQLLPSCIDVPRGVGREYFSRFETTYEGLDRAVEVGHFYDQMAALIALTNTTAQVVGVGSDVAADARRFRIPYNLAFAQKLSDLYSAIFAGDDSAYAWRVRPSPGGGFQLVPREAAFPAVEAEAAAALPLISPGRSKTAQVQALVAGMTMLDGSLNATFAQRGQISLLGSGEQRTTPEGFEPAHAVDPLTGRAFVAYRRSDGAEGPWYAAELVDRAQEIADDPASEDADIELIFGDVELVRLASSIFGK